MTSQWIKAALARGLAAVLIGFLASVSLPALGDALGTADPATTDGLALEQSDLEARWGIKVLGIRLVAANHILDFRYQVVDPVKAAPILDRNYEPYLIDQATGAVMAVPHPPKVGGLRQNTETPAAGRAYFILFANPGRTVKNGDNMTVVVGDFWAKNIKVGS